MNLFTQYNYDRHLRFLGHMLRGTYSPHARTCSLRPQPTRRTSWKATCCKSFSNFHLCSKLPTCRTSWQLVGN